MQIEHPGTAKHVKTEQIEHPKAAEHVTNTQIEHCRAADQDKTTQIEHPRAAEHVKQHSNTAPLASYVDETPTFDDFEAHKQPNL